MAGTQQPTWYGGAAGIIGRMRMLTPSELMQIQSGQPVSMVEIESSTEFADFDQLKPATQRRIVNAIRRFTGGR